MPTKAKLTIRLYADDKLIAEIDNAALWNKILSYDVDEPITLTQLESGRAYSQMSETVPGGKGGLVEVDQYENSLSSIIAKDIGVSEEQVEGSLSPQKEEPYIVLEHKNWSLYKKSLPSKGAGAYPDVVIVATLLLIVLRSLGIKEVAKKTVSQVVSEMGGSTRNSQRSYKNCQWIKVETEKIKLNPAKFEEANSVFVGFVQAN